MKTFEDFHPLLASTIAGIAGEYGRKGHWYGASHEDFTQEMLAWLLVKEADVAERMTESVEDATRYVAKCLRNECKDYLQDVKAQSLGYERDDLYWYTRNEVKALLPTMFNKAAWTEPPQHEGTSGGGKSPAEGGNWIATLADIAQAYERLNSEDKSIIAALHHEGYTNKLLAEVYGITEANMSYRHNRAVQRLQKLLGGDKPRATREGRDPWKGRNAVTNSTARAYQSNQYDEGVSA